MQCKKFFYLPKCARRLVEWLNDWMLPTYEYTQQTYIYCLAGIVKIISLCGKSNLSTKKYIIENWQTNRQTHFFFRKQKCLLSFSDVSSSFCHHQCVNSHKYHISLWMVMCKHKILLHLPTTLPQLAHKHPFPYINSLQNKQIELKEFNVSMNCFTANYLYYLNYLHNKIIFIFFQISIYA